MTDWVSKSAFIVGGGIALGVGGLLVYDELYVRIPDPNNGAGQIVGGVVLGIIALAAFWGAWHFGNAEKPAAPPDEREQQEKSRQAFHEKAAGAGSRSGTSDRTLLIYRIIGFGGAAAFLGLSYIALRAEEQTFVRGISLFGAAVCFFVSLGGLLFAWVESKAQGSDRTSGPHAALSAAPADAVQVDQLDAQLLVQAGYTIKDRAILRSCGANMPDSIDGLGRFVLDDHRDVGKVTFVFTGVKIGALVAILGVLLMLSPILTFFAPYKPVLEFLGKIIAMFGGFFFAVLLLVHLVFVKGRLGYRLEIDKNAGTVNYHTYWFSFHFKNKYSLRTFDHIFITRILVTAQDSQGNPDNWLEFRVYLAGTALLGIIYFDTVEKAHAFAGKLSKYLNYPVKVTVDQETVL